MIDESIKINFNEANKLFDQAQEELCKPEEDVVPYVVCHTLYKSSILYLKAWMMQNGFEVGEKDNLEQLLTRCRKADNRFKDLKLEPLFNANVTDEVWMSLDKVREFVDLTNQTRSLIGVS